MHTKGFIALAAVVALLSACREEFVPPDENNTTGTNNPTNNSTINPGLGNIGEDCGTDAGCNPGLVCRADSGTCQAPGDVGAGEACFRSAECDDGLYCEPTAGVCASSGSSDAGGPCGSTGDCQKGLVCAPAGFGGECVASGENDVGDTCEGYFDCLAGLGCAPSPTDPDGPATCQPGLAGLPIPWAGVECAESEDGNFRPYFEVPDGDVTEFYRLPYPNDIRAANGRPVLDGHPTPGDGILGYDLVQRYIDKIEADQNGFGLNSWAFMRFSEQIDFDSVKVGGDDATLYVAVLSSDSDNYGDRVSMRYRANTARNKYMCQNWLAVRPGGNWGRPMAPNTTYGVILTTGVRSSGGVAASQDEDFAAMLADSQPSGALGDAWEAYQPLRDWAADQQVDTESIASAIVFTTGDPTAEAAGLAAPARADVPTTSELTLCEEGTASPCDDELEGDEHRRGCFGAGDGFHEVQGKISLPIFQQGDAPYFDSGGNVSTSVERREDVCMAMTVPDATMPEEGWPVLVYAHGTDGTYRGHVANGTAGLVNAIDVDGETVRFLTVGWDQVQHFTRRADSQMHPNELVFNYGNPDAAKGNFLQAAADIHAVMAWAEQVDIPAADSPTGAPIKADPANIYFMGHSQGGTSGPLALPFDTTSKGAVLSGAGAGLVLALLGKTEPVNSPAAVAFVLQETSEVTQTHPVLNLLQAYFDPVDPVNFGALMGAQVIDGVTTPKSVFHTNGLGDNYSPNTGMDAMARALRATYILPWEEEIDGVPAAEAPFSGNVTHDPNTFTIVGRQYAPPAGRDGHFVVFDNETAEGDLAEFLGTAVTTGIPEVR